MYLYRCPVIVVARAIKQSYDGTVGPHRFFSTWNQKIATRAFPIFYVLIKHIRNEVFPRILTVIIKNNFFPCSFWVRKISLYTHLFIIYETIKEKKKTLSVKTLTVYNNMHTRFFRLLNMQNENPSRFIDRDHKVSKKLMAFYATA